jgi:hypothetical protein
MYQAIVKQATNMPSLFNAQGVAYHQPQMITQRQDA